MQTILYVLFLIAVFYIPFVLLQIFQQIGALAVILKVGEGKTTLLPYGAWLGIPAAITYIVWFVGV